MGFHALTSCCTRYRTDVLSLQQHLLSVRKIQCQIIFQTKLTLLGRVSTNQTNTFQSLQQWSTLDNEGTPVKRLKANFDLMSYSPLFLSKHKVIWKENLSVHQASLFVRCPFDYAIHPPGWDIIESHNPSGLWDSCALTIEQRRGDDLLA